MAFALVSWTAVVFGIAALWAARERPAPLAIGLLALALAAAFWAGRIS